MFGIPLDYKMFKHFFEKLLKHKTSWADVIMYIIKRLFRDCPISVF